MQTRILKYARINALYTALMTVILSAQVFNNVNYSKNDIPRQFKDRENTIPEYYLKHLIANNKAFDSHHTDSDSGIHLISQYFRGGCSVVAISGKYIYAGCGPSMIVIDVTDVLLPSIVFEYKTFFDGRGNVNDIQIRDSLLYLLDGSSFQILNINNPAHPTLIGKIDSPPGTVTDKISLNDSLAYILHLNNGGINIVNIKDPTNPYVMKSGGGVGFGATTISSRKGIVYSGSFESTSDGLYIFNYTNLDSLSLEFLNTNGWVMETMVKDTLLFVGVDSRPGHHVKVYSITKPSAPKLISDFILGVGYPDYIINALAVKDSSLFVSTVSKGIYEIDISDPTLLKTINHISNRSQYYPATGNNIVFSKSHLFISNISGVLTLSAFPDDSLRIVGFSPIGSQFNDIVVKDTLAYVADYYGLGIYNVAQPQQIIKIADIEAPGPTVQVKILSHYAFVTCDYQGTAIFDITDPFHPQYLSTAKYVLNDGANPTDILVTEKILFVLDYNDGVLSFDVSDKSAPKYLSKYRLPRFNLSLAICDSVLYVARMDSGIALINISHPESALLIKNISVTAECIKIYGSVLYVKGDGYFSKFAIGDPSNPILMEKTSVEGAYGHGSMVVENNWLYHRRSSTLYAIKLLGPDHFKNQYGLNVGNAPFGLDVVGSMIYVCNATKGIQIYKNDQILNVTQNAVAPRCFLFQNYPNPFNPTSTIRYALPRASTVMLKVYDVLGREISTLVNDHQESGSYTVNFDGSWLSSGMYFYKLTSGSFTQTKRMMLLK